MAVIFATEFTMSGQPKYSADEHARRGTDRYERHVRPLVESDNHGKVVAMDVDTGEFELADNSLNACQRLLARCPAAQIWCVRVGHPAMHNFGPRTVAARTC